MRQRSAWLIDFTARRPLFISWRGEDFPPGWKGAGTAPVAPNSDRTAIWSCVLTTSYVGLCSAHRHRSLPDRPLEWLLIEWPDGEEEPTRYWLSTLPEEVGLGRMVELTKLRWRIERDYQELKQELGLDHFEGRSWRGLHHHATLTMVPSGEARNLRFPPVTDPEAPPLRPERHLPNSITTMRRRLIFALVQTLPRCPCCAVQIRRRPPKHL